MQPGRHPLLALALVVLSAPVGAQDTPPPLQIHGFGSWVYGRTNQNIFLAGAPGIAAALALGFPEVPRAQESFVVIVNVANAVTSLPRMEVSRLFLRKKTRWPNGQQVLPIDQVESSPVRRRFSDVVHGMDTPSVKSFWQELVFSGKGEPPPERASDADVIAYVKANPGALGYISSAAPAAGVKIVVVAP